MELLLGLATGVLFGFLLQKARVIRFEKQVGFLCLRDMTIIQFMFSAILVGMIGIYLLKDLGAIELNVKPTILGAQIIGGLLFGCGWAVAGYCPGTSIGAAGEGRVHAIWVILGMLIGAAVYAEVYPMVSRSIGTWGAFGKITIPGLLHINHWIVITVFVVCGLVLFGWFRRQKM